MFCLCCEKKDWDVIFLKSYDLGLDICSCGSGDSFINNWDETEGAQLSQPFGFNW